MDRDANSNDFDYEGSSPQSKLLSVTKLGPNGARFIVTRKKGRQFHEVTLDVEWSEVISFETCEVNIGKDEKSWPLDEDLPSKFNVMGPAGMLFLFLKPSESTFFQIWGFIPLEDTLRVRELMQTYLEQPSLPGLAHHGTTAAVRYVVDHCNVIERHTAHWHEWLRRGPIYKPKEKLREKGPDYVFCKEGMAIDFIGASAELEQMSVFWPWRVMEDISVVDREILYRWEHSAYTFRQLVWDDERRNRIFKEATDAFELYCTSEHVKELPLIKPWSFPSSFHETWDDLDPFSSKASRIAFPPIDGLETDPS